MAENDSTTKLSFTFEEIGKVKASLIAIRGIGDLLTGAADSIRHGRYNLLDSTLEDIGMHLEDMAAEGLVILRYDSAKPTPEGGE